VNTGGSGLFVVLEGVDGAGTTTQAARLRTALAQRGTAALVTREPTPGPIGSVLRQALGHRFVVPTAEGPKAPSWQTMALLFAADRLDHLDAEIVPALLRGETVISDRYDLSSVAYQTATAPLDEAAEATRWVRELNRHARRPDLTIVLHVRAEVAEARRRGRGGAVDLYETSELQRRLVAAYREAEVLCPGDTFVHLDGEKTPDEVAADILAATLASLGAPHGTQAPGRLSNELDRFGAFSARSRRCLRFVVPRSAWWSALASSRPRRLSRSAARTKRTSLPLVAPQQPPPRLPWPESPRPRSAPSPPGTCAAKT
jgi:dTMP kinase